MTPFKLFAASALLVSVSLALFVGPSASPAPDGLEKVASEQGFGDAAKESPVQGGPLAGYSVRGVEDERLGTGVAGLVGTLLTFGLGLGLFGLVRAAKSRSNPA